MTNMTPNKLKQIASDACAQWGGRRGLEGELALGEALEQRRHAGIAEIGVGQKDRGLAALEARLVCAWGVCSRGKSRDYDEWVVDGSCDPILSQVQSSIWRRAAEGHWAFNCRISPHQTMRFEK